MIQPVLIYKYLLYLWQNQNITFQSISFLLKVCNYKRPCASPLAFLWISAKIEQAKIPKGVLQWLNNRLNFVMTPSF